MTRQRVQKIISNAGYCSRRKAEELIAQGKVTVNGLNIKLGDQADPDKDTIMVGKQRIEQEKHLYILLHKPSGYITTRGDLWDRKDVMQLLEGVPRPVYPVGRLDRDARGLLLLTSDGDFAQQVLHPSNRTTKTYQATLDKPLDKRTPEQVREGVIVDGRRVTARLYKIKPKLVELTIHEGRNKIVKRYFKALGYYVRDLKRVAIGPIRLNIPEGQWRELTEAEKEKLLEKKPRRTAHNIKEGRPLRHHHARSAPSVRPHKPDRAGQRQAAGPHRRQTPPRGHNPRNHPPRRRE